MARESLRSACFSQLTISCCSRLVNSTFCKWNVDDSVKINSVGNAPSTPIKLKTIAARQLSQCGNCFNFEWWFSLDCRIYNQFLVKHFPSRWQNKFHQKKRPSTSRRMRTAITIKSSSTDKTYDNVSLWGKPAENFVLNSRNNGCLWRGSHSVKWPLSIVRR